MKNFKIIMILLVLGMTTQSNAQEASELAVEQKVEEKTERETEKTFDTVFNNKGKIFKNKRQRSLKDTPLPTNTS